MNTSQMKLMGVLLIIVALALCVTGARRWDQPALFHATATVKVERDKIDRTELGAIVPAAVDSTFFIQTEIELMQSEAPLSQVIEKLNLNQAWGKKYGDGQSLETRETFQRLKGRLQLQPIPGTTNIQIQAASDDAEESAGIANGVAQAYCDYRAGYRRRRAQDSLTELSEKFKVLEEKITMAQKNVKEAGQELDPALRGTAVTNQMGSEKLESLRSRYSTSVLRYSAQSNQFVLFSATSGHDEEVASQLQQKAEKTKVEMLAAEAALKDELRKLDSLRTFQSAQQELDELNSAPLKKNVEKLQHELNTREHPPATIIEPATIPTKPDVPAETPGWTFLVGGGFALALGVALFLMAGKPAKLA